MLKHFPGSILLTIGSVVGVYFTLGLSAAITTLILIAIEVSFSFDNAVINAKILERLSQFWRTIFLTLGMLIAIVGMRLVFPILIVSVTANLAWQKVVDLALNHPEEYAHYLEGAHTTISSFGGAFLLVLTLYFFLDHTREVIWLKRIERPLQRIKGGGLWLAPAIAAVVMLILSRVADHGDEVIRAGLAGVITYTAIHALIQGLSKIADKSDSGVAKAGAKAAQYTGWSAALAFLYLEILDASFSFDGVLGAFAITDSVPIIAIGLGVGALWVRTLTVFMVKNGTLAAYRYLEHGAHYAIFVLVIALLVGLFVTIPEVITGISGIGVIAASLIASKEANKAGEKVIPKTAKAKSSKSK